MILHLQFMVTKAQRLILLIIMYALSAEGRIEYIFSKRCDCRVSPSEEDQTLINEIIEEIGAPLVDAQPAPDWNLQWLYNLLNQNR